MGMLGVVNILKGSNKNKLRFNLGHIMWTVFLLLRPGHVCLGTFQLSPGDSIRDPWLWEVTCLTFLRVTFFTIPTKVTHAELQDTDKYKYIYNIHIVLINPVPIDLLKSYRFKDTLPKTNISPLKTGRAPKGNVIFQLQLFRCYVRFWWVFIFTALSK